MTLNSPNWLDETLIRTCLQDGEGRKPKHVKILECTSPTSAGNNYGSCLRRVKVEYQDINSDVVHCLPLIVKGPLEEGATMKEAFKQLSLTEPIFYRSFLLKSPESSFAPKSYFSTLPDVVVLEDLQTQGYLMADRCKQLDFDHCRLYAIASATFHAVSVAVHKNHSDLVESLGSEKMFSSDLDFGIKTKKVILSGLYVMAEKMELLDDYKAYSKLLRSFSTIMWDTIVQIHKKNSVLDTLHQGDPWTTNMMFKYDLSGNVTDIKLLDFQALRFSCPVNDLVFFVWTSANEAVRENRLEEFYRTYCETLNKKLKEFNCPERLTYEQLLDNLRFLNPVALVVCAAYFPLLTSNKPVDVEALVEEDGTEAAFNVFRDIYDRDYCEFKLPAILRQLQSAGAFHYIETQLLNK